MLSHHTHPGGSDEPKYLVTTTHLDGTICHHTGGSWGEVKDYASEHAEASDKVEYFAIAPGRIDGIHWQLVA